MQHKQTSHIHGPLTTPKLFRRPISAHDIIASLLLADLVGMLLFLLCGALIGPPAWWLLRFFWLLCHGSLPLAIASVLILFIVVVGLVRQRLWHYPAGDAWAGPILCIAGILGVLLILKLLQVSLLTLPTLAIPTIRLEHFPWPPQVAPLGVAIAAALSLFAHLLVSWRYRRASGPGGSVLTYSRAYPDGNLCRITDQAYSIYQEQLARFDAPPIAHLNTPPTFLHYPETPPDNPEQGAYWLGDSLILPLALLGPKTEQAEILLPLLARLLHDYQNPALRWTEMLFQLARVAKKHRFTRRPLWLPLRIVPSCRQGWQLLEKDHILDRDRFAYWCGQGYLLRELLRKQLNRQQRNDQPDNTIPTLAERIDHLESLLKRRRTPAPDITGGTALLLTLIINQHIQADLTISKLYTCLNKYITWKSKQERCPMGHTLLQ